MVKRSHEEWRGLFEAHANSGLTERAFCGARGLCPKHFNLRKKQLGWVGWGSLGAYERSIQLFVNRS